MLTNSGYDEYTPEDILMDNFSCNTIEDIREIFKDTLSNKQISGLIGSLENKGVLWVEERNGLEDKFEPDLYWVDDDFLETLENKPMNEILQ